MSKYTQQINEIVNSLTSSAFQGKGFGVVAKRPLEDFTPFLRLGAPTAALVLCQAGTKDIYRTRNAAAKIQSTIPITEEDSVDRLIDVQMELTRDVRTRIFRRKQDWTIPRKSWGEIFTGTGVKAVDQLLQTDMLFVGNSAAHDKGLMFYLPWNGHDIAGAARLICEQMFDKTSDPIFDIGVSDRK